MKRKVLALALCCVLIGGTLFCGCSTTEIKSSSDPDAASAFESVESESSANESEVTAVSAVSDTQSSVEATSSSTSTSATSKPATTTSTLKPSAGTLGNTTTSDSEIFPSKWAATKSKTDIPANLKQNVKSGSVQILAAGKMSSDEKAEIEKAFQKLTGQKLVLKETIVDWNSLRSQLQTMVLANKGPDVFGPVYNGVTVYLRNKGLMRDINEYINMNDAAFTDMQAYCKVLYYDKKLTGVGVDLPTMAGGIMYNKSMMQNAGLTEPWELYKQGKWTTDVLIDYAKKLTQVKNGVTQVYGLSAVYYEYFRMGLATGEDLVSINKAGKFVSNLDSTVWTRYASYARAVANAKSKDPLVIVKNNVLNGTSAMRTSYGNDLLADSVAIKQRKEGRIGWVPYPKDPETKTYYMAAEQSYYNLPEKSSNPWGGAALIYAMRYVNANKDLNAEKTKYVNEYGFTQEMAEFLVEGIYKDITPAFGNWQHLPDFDYTVTEAIYTQDWSVVKEKIAPSFKKALAQANK